MKRRDFLKSVAIAGLTIQQGDLGVLEAALADKDSGGELPRRPYKGGVQLSVIGFGGFLLVGMAQKEADAIVARSVARGLNYFDVAPTYGRGHEAELKLGPALRPHREGAFLACKTTKRDAEGARLELEGSLRRLKTDHFDLYQLHAMTKMEDVDKVFGPRGAMEAFEKARDEGKVRFLGFSAHSEEAAIALMDRYPFDSVLFPVNYVCYAQGRFGPGVVAKAREKDVARLALKAMAYTPWASGEERVYPNCWYRPTDQLELGRQALRFTLSEAVTSAVPPASAKLFEMAMRFACAFEPMREDERKALLATTTSLKPIFARA
jgi:predicted aldo/keto reductase-like oxidoreductase